MRTNYSATQSSSLDSVSIAPSFEMLESRLMLSGAAPTFGTALSDGYWVPSGGGTRVIGIDGADADNDITSITAVSNNPNLIVTVPTGNSFARLHFVASDGTTVIGDIVVQLFDNGVDWAASATAAERFITLATNHVNADGSLDPAADPFYTDVVVHRVIDGFMIQTGDAKNGDGTGGSPLGTFADTFDPDLSFVGAGILAMANSGSNTNDCQFFITDAPTSWLDGVHMIFGQLVSGWDVMNTITNLPTDSSTNRPTNPPKLESVTIFTTVQDATVALKSDSSFTGTADVTITITDSQGNSVDKVIHVMPQGEMGGITITPPAQQSVTPGTSKTVAATFTQSAGLPMTYSASTSFTSITASVNQTTQQVTVAVPNTFTGLYRVTLSAVPTGWADVSPTTADFMASSQNAVDPELQGNIDNTTGTSYKAVGYGQYALLAAGSAGIIVYDVSDPTHPTQVSSYSAGGSDSARDIQIVGTTAFVTEVEGGFVTLDITDPTNIHLISRLTLSASTTYAVTSAIDTAKHIAYIATYTAGVIEVDISNPAAMTVLRTLKTWGGFSLTYAVDISLKGNYAFVCDSAGGVVVLNVTDPANSALVTTFGTGYQPWNVEVVGNRLYVADQSLQIYDITNPLKMKTLGGISMSGAWQVAVFGNMAVVSDDYGVEFVDVTNPKKLVVEYTFAVPTFTSMAGLVGNNVLVPAGSDGLVILQGTRKFTNTSMTFVDGAGVPVTVKITGGTAKVLTTGFGAGTIESIEITGSGSASTLAITTPSGRTTTVGDITVTAGALKSLVGKTVNLTGDITIAGSIETLTLYDVIGTGHTISIGTTAGLINLSAKAKITLHNVNDLILDCEMPVTSLTVNSWNDTAANDSITAWSIGTLTVKGDLDAAVSLSGTGAPVKTLGTAKITGNISGYDWDIAGNIGTITVIDAMNWAIEGYQPASPLGNIAALTINNAANVSIASSGYVAKIKAANWNGGTTSAIGVTSMAVKGQYSNVSIKLSQAMGGAKPSLGSMTVGGWMDNVDVISKDNLGKFTVGGMSNSNIYAGVADVDDALITVDLISSGDLSQATIAGVTVKGITGALDSFVNSNLTAWNLGTISLNKVQESNGGTQFGLAARTIKSYKVIHDLGSYNWSIKTAAWPTDSQNDYIVRQI